MIVGASPVIPYLIDYYTPKTTPVATTLVVNHSTAAGIPGTTAGSTPGGNTPGTTADSAPGGNTPGTTADSTPESSDPGGEPTRTISRPAAIAALVFAGLSVLGGLVVVIRRRDPDR